MTSEYGDRISRARAQFDSEPRLSRIHQAFGECIHSKLGGLPLGVRSNASWMPREMPTLLLRDDQYYRWLTMRFIRDPECDSKNGHCGNCLFHYQMVAIPVGAHADAMAFVVERSALTGQTDGKPWGPAEAMLELTPEQVVIEGRLATLEDIESVHRHFHYGQEQAS
jgi:hypothetical protein